MRIETARDLSLENEEEEEEEEIKERSDEEGHLSSGERKASQREFAQFHDASRRRF